LPGVIGLAPEVSCAVHTFETTPPEKHSAALAGPSQPARRVGASLRNYRDKGTIRSIKDGRYGKYDLWEIAV
jgi:hypothetical protein